MAEKIENKFMEILSRVSEREKMRNRALAHQTKRVLIAIARLKAAAKLPKGA